MGSERPHLETYTNRYVFRDLGFGGPPTVMITIFQQITRVVGEKFKASCVSRVVLILLVILIDYKIKPIQLFLQRAIQTEKEFDPDREYDTSAPDNTKVQSPKYANVQDDTKLQSSKDKEDLTNPEENKRLVTMGINTAIAIGLHNFPGGLATFVACTI